MGQIDIVAVLPDGKKNLKKCENKNYPSENALTFGQATIKTSSNLLKEHLGRYP